MRHIATVTAETHYKITGKSFIVIAYDVDTKEFLGVSEKFTVRDAKTVALRNAHERVQNKNVTSHSFLTITEDFVMFDTGYGYKLKTINYF